MCCTHHAPRNVRRVPRGSQSLTPDLGSARELDNEHRQDNPQLRQCWAVSIPCRQKDESARSGCCRSGPNTHGPSLPQALSLLNISFLQIHCTLIRDFTDLIWKFCKWDRDGGKQASPRGKHAPVLGMWPTSVQGQKLVSLPKDLDPAPGQASPAWAL